MLESYNCSASLLTLDVICTFHFSYSRGYVLVTVSIEQFFVCLLIIYTYVCVYIYLSVWSAYSNLLPRVLLGFLLTINFEGSYLYILKSSLLSCIFIPAIFSCSEDFPVYFLMVSFDD